MYVIADGHSSANYAAIVAAVQAPGANATAVTGQAAVLSARPDGPNLNLFSVVVVLPLELAAALVPAISASADIPGVFSKDQMLNTSVHVRSMADAELECAWVNSQPVHHANLFRLMCSSDTWHARTSMASRRLDMTLSLSMPGFRASVDFVTEAISALQSRAGASVCLDMQYMAFVPKRDFDEWAFALELTGIDRIYVPDQLVYRARSASQAARGFVAPTHDFPHRYVLPPGRDVVQQTSYHMEEETDKGSSFLCLHDHWYDDWIGVAWSPDEYLSFEGLGVPPPTARSNLASVAIRAFTNVRMNATASQPRWPFCLAEVCMNRPFFGPRVRLSGEATEWTMPIEGVKLQYSGGGMLAVERFTKRFTSLPTISANRKCFLRPDWRLGLMKVKKHGTIMQSCPPRLQAKECALARHPAMRRPCLDLCGVWGNETCESCRAAPAPGCGAQYEAARGHTTASGDVMGGVDLAHFRIAPNENQVAGFRDVQWLSNLSVHLRPLVEVANT